MLDDTTKQIKNEIDPETTVTTDKKTITSNKRLNRGQGRGFVM